LSARKTASLTSPGIVGPVFTGFVLERIGNFTAPTEEVQTEARFFTVEEVGKIIAAAREPYKTMFWLLAMTGMRAGEMLGLQWADIDFEKGLLNIRNTAASSSPV
jgi:integrase